MILKRWWWRTITVLGFASVVYARQLGHLDITRMALLINKLPPELDGFKVVQFSDLHMDRKTTTRARLAEVVEAINAEAPDVIAFTGDFITEYSDFTMEDLILPLRDLRAAECVVAVMGNHDHRMNTGVIRRVMRDSGMIDLNNKVHTVRRGDACLHFAGVDSVMRQRARLDQVMAQLPAEGTAILLAHEPDFADISAATNRFVLQLSGHSHGGQIRIPLLTRLALPPHSQRYSMGVMQADKMMVYTNRGIGVVGLPLRFNCPPEIAVITLRAAEQMSR
jgi:predicted MPP superfamily phosphohydrolase